MERALMSPPGYQFLLHLAPRIDKLLIPLTNGRLSSAGVGKFWLVTTIGAKSGRPRTHPLTLIVDGGGLLAIGSNYGRSHHPAWTANLLAHPECTVEFMAGPRSTEPSCSRAMPTPRHGPRPPTSTPGTSAIAQAAHHARSGSFAFGPSPPEEVVGARDLRCSRPVQPIVGVRSLTAHEHRLCWLYACRSGRQLLRASLRRPPYRRRPVGR